MFLTSHLMLFSSEIKTAHMVNMTESATYNFYHDGSTDTDQVFVSCAGVLSHSVLNSYCFRSSEEVRRYLSCSILD
jgi:hypothetical protein